MQRSRRFALILAVGLAACGYNPRPHPGGPGRFEAPPRDRCEVARGPDFDGAGQVELQRYIDELVGTHGAGLLAPGDVTLAIADSRPKLGRRGVIAGEIGCGGGKDGPYRITLYRKALEGRQLQAAYHTIAREFQHIVQIRRDGLSCVGGDPGDAARYEAEAVRVADRLVPACARAAPARDQQQ